MRASWVAVLAVAAALAGCSSDAGSTTETTAAPETTVSAAQVATTPAPGALAATGGEDEEAAATPVLTPIALCVEGGATTYFAYENSGDEPIAVDLGPDNEFVVTERFDDDPLVPTVFAPGYVSPAFASEDAERWTITGPDGLTTTAFAADAPVCTDRLLRPTTPDERNPAIAIAWTPVRDGSDELTGVEVTASIVGVPAASVCPPGLEPEDVLVGFLPTARGGGGPGRELSETVPFERGTLASGEVRLAAGVSYEAIIVDRCSGGGAVTQSWRAADLGFGPEATFCFRAALPSPLVAVQDLERSAASCAPDPDLPPLPPTGGGRIRTTSLPEG
jgi:hypothetical protein